MAGYTRLTLLEREELSLWLLLGWRYREIAVHLQRSPSTVSREVRRNRLASGGYRAVAAQHRAQRRRRYGHGRRLDRNVRLRCWVLQRLRRCGSPEQIARRWRMAFAHDESMRLSHAALYTYLYVLPRGAWRRELLGYLRQHRQRRRPRRRGHAGGAHHAHRAAGAAYSQGRDECAPCLCQAHQDRASPDAFVADP